MAGELKLNDVSVATESGGVVSLSAANTLAFPSGHILKVVSSSFNGIQTIGTSDTDITNLSCSMTITSGNKVLILVSLYTGHGSGDYGIYRIVDGSNSAIYQNTTGSGNQSNASMVSSSNNIGNDVHRVVNNSLNYLWTPGVTSITVKVRGRCADGSNVYINRSENVANGYYANRATSHLTIMEVVA